jgi:DNA-binding transcriptional regulator of glucitol operon
MFSIVSITTSDRGAVAAHEHRGRFCRRLVTATAPVVRYRRAIKEHEKSKLWD